MNQQVVFFTNFCLFSCLYRFKSLLFRLIRWSYCLSHIVNLTISSVWLLCCVPLLLKKLTNQSVTTILSSLILAYKQVFKMQITEKVLLNTLQIILFKLVLDSFASIFGFLFNSFDLFIEYGQSRICANCFRQILVSPDGYCQPWMQFIEHGYSHLIFACISYPLHNHFPFSKREQCGYGLSTLCGWWLVLRMNCGQTITSRYQLLGDIRPVSSFPLINLINCARRNPTVYWQHQSLLA